MKRLIISLLALTAFGATAATITLDTGSLPSTQGWEFRAIGMHAGIAETDMFSVSGSVLTMNNMDEPVNWNRGGAYSVLYGVVEDSMDTVLEWTSRTVEYETVRGEGPHFGFTVCLNDGKYRYVVGISKSHISLNNGTGYHTFPFDATEYHTYRIQTVTGTSVYDFYIDDTLQATLSGRPDSTPNLLYIGDSTSTANAKSEITYLKFSQLSFDIGLTNPLNSDGCVEATGPEGATVHLFADESDPSPTKTYSWSTSSGDTGSGEIFETVIGVDQQVEVTLTSYDTATEASDTVAKTVCVSDTTAPEIVILSPQNGDVFIGNNLGLNVLITDAVDKNISEYLVSLSTSYWAPLDPGSEISTINLLKPAAEIGPVPTDVLVSAQDASGNAASATVQVMLQHNNRDR